MKKRIAGYTLIAVAGMVAWCLLLDSSRATGSYFGPADIQRFSWVYASQVAFGYVVLLTGVFLGVSCRGLIEKQKEGDGEVEIMRFLKGRLRKIDFWISTLASPVIFGGILTTGVDMAYGAFLFFALQTGFSSYVAATALLQRGRVPAAPPTHEGVTPTAPSQDLPR